MFKDSELADLAADQHGLVASYQALGIGMSRASVSRRRRAADWDLLTPRVLRRAGAPRTTAQRAMAAVLDAGPAAWLSYTSAAAWWGLAGFDLEPFHVTRRKGVGRRRSSLAIVHDITDVEPRHVTVLDDVPVVRPELMAYELCATVHPRRAERAIDSAWNKRLLSGRSLRAVLGDLAEQGRNGTTVLRDILDRRGDDYVPPASNLEARFDSLLSDAGLRAMRRQVDLGDDTAWTGRVDFVADDVPLVVEILSERYHTALVDREADDRRIAALRAAGFTVLTFWDVQVWHHGAAVVAEVRAARRALRGSAA
jgi:very-short-patch-repair endonuclease